MLASELRERPRSYHTGRASNRGVYFRDRARFAESSRLPVYATKEYVDVGGLMSYGPSLVDLWRRAAVYVDKILKGAKPPPRRSACLRGCY